MIYDLAITPKKRTKKEIDNILKLLSQLEKLDNEIFEDIDL